jgi:membrane-associated phospholipid phosphatase
VIAWFHLTLAAVLLIAGGSVPGRWLLFAAYVGVSVGALAGGRLLAAGGTRRGALQRSIVCMVLIPLSFTSLGWLLPAVHQEPYEWTMMRLDRTLFGDDAHRIMAPLTSPVVSEALQLVYSTFYFLPVVVGVSLWRAGRWREMDDAVTLVAFGFFVSYLGYLLWPTLAPYHFLEHEEPLTGLFAFDGSRALLDRLEHIKQDCVPSGHVMMSLVTLVLAARLRLVAFWALLPVVTLLCVSTVYLRYHYIVDTVFGAALVPPVLWFHDRLLRGRPA